MVRAVIVALIHVLIVCSLGAKLLYDRRTRPQAWFKTERFDPNLPIRGRYLSLQIDVPDSRSPKDIEKMFGSQIQGFENQRKQSTYNRPHLYDFGRECGSLGVRAGTPVVEFDQSEYWNCDNLAFVRWKAGDEIDLRLDVPVLFFISDTAKDPSRLNREKSFGFWQRSRGRGLPGRSRSASRKVHKPKFNRWVLIRH